MMLMMMMMNDDDDDDDNDNLFRAGGEARLARATRAMHDAEQELMGKASGAVQSLYDDEYDDSFDEFGTIDLGERTAETEERSR